MIKAAREAKLSTSWGNVNTEYEEALTQFVRTTLEAREGNLFLTDLVSLQKRISRFGLLNGLSQVLCKLTAPGVPDIYQGNDTWDFSLVDPDNRRPVDYNKRRVMLAQLRDATPPMPELIDNIKDGRAKLYLTWKLLQFRRDHAELFRRGDYIPLTVTGDHATNLCAFARRCGNEFTITLAPRLYRRLLGDEERPPVGADVWENTVVELPRDFARPFKNILDGTEVPVSNGTLRVAQALANFPVGLLVGQL